MDCYFHSNVPSVAPCQDCGKSICATCRDERGNCPSCRLAAKIDSAGATRSQIGGQVPPRPSTPPPPFSASPPAPQPRASVATLDSVESRALVALGYPLWPLALIALLDRKQSPMLRRQTYTALAFNGGMAALWGALTLATQLPWWLGGEAALVQAIMIPLFLVASVIFGIKTWNGENVRVPIVSDWIDERLPAN